MRAARVCAWLPGGHFAGCFLGCAGCVLVGRFRWNRRWPLSVGGGHALPFTHVRPARSWTRPHAGAHARGGHDSHGEASVEKTGGKH